MNNLNKLTLITLSYERQELLIRNVNFWKNKGCKHLILDGSSRALDKKVLDEWGASITYLHAPISYQKRFALIGDYLKTQYYILAADDDFYFPNTLKNSIKFLDENNDYSACCGRPLGFEFDAKVGVCVRPGVYNDMNNNYKIDDITPRNRMISHMGRYMPSTMYAVLRTVNWDLTVGHYINKEYSIFSIIELEMELITAYLGKSIVLPELGWLKSIELDQINTDEPTFKRDRELHNIWPMDAEKDSFRLDYLASMSQWLSKADNRNIEEISIEIDTAMNAYVLWCEKYFTENISLFYFREKIKFIFSSNMLTSLLKFKRKFINRFFKYKKRVLFREYLDFLRSTGCDVDLKDQQSIEHAIKQFYSKNVNG